MKAAQIIALSALALVLLSSTASKPLFLYAKLLRFIHAGYSCNSIFRLFFRSPHIYLVCLSVSLVSVTFGNNFQVACPAVLDVHMCMLLMTVVCRCPELCRQWNQPEQRLRSIHPSHQG